MLNFSLLDGLLSAGVVSALLATGAFVQKSKDNSTEIVALKERVSSLESERTEIATLTTKLSALESVFKEFKSDLRTDFKEFKEILIRSSLKS